MAKSESQMPSPDTDRELTLDEMIGHTQTRAFLKESIRANRFPQSVLLAGPPGIGKKTLAWSIIKEIVARGADPREHAGAKKVTRRTHPDVRVCDTGTSVSGQIVVEAIRDVEDWSATAPIESHYKFALIAPADAMNLSAANSLLKVLEEPPSRLVLILTATDPSALLPTIRSRCTPFALDAVPKEEIVPWLERKTRKSREEVELAAALAEGRPGFALSILSEGALEQRKQILNELALLKQEGFAAVFGVADRLSGLGSTAGTLNTVLLLLRDLLAVRMETGEVLNRDLIDDLKTLANGISSEGLLKAAGLVAEGIDEGGRYYSQQSQAHFMELLTIGVGRELRANYAV